MSEGADRAHSSALGWVRFRNNTFPTILFKVFLIISLKTRWDGRSPSGRVRDVINPSGIVRSKEVATVGRNAQAQHSGSPGPETNLQQNCGYLDFRSPSRKEESREQLSLPSTAGFVYGPASS